MLGIQFKIVIFLLSTLEKYIFQFFLQLCWSHMTKQWPMECCKPPGMLAQTLSPLSMWLHEENSRKREPQDGGALIPE